MSLLTFLFDHPVITLIIIGIVFYFTIGLIPGLMLIIKILSTIITWTASLITHVTS